MIRIGILIDDYNVPHWVNELLEEIKKDNRYSIEGIIVNRGRIRKPFFNKLAYRLLRKADQTLMELPDSHLTKEKIIETGAKLIEVQPLQGKYTDAFSPEDIERIRELHADLLLRFGFRILKGEILSVAEYGVLSLHHGDTDSYRGGPPAFWEVVNREAVTAVTLQQLTAQLDGGRIIDKAFIRTDTNSFIRNQHKLYRQGFYLFKRVLQQIATQGPGLFFDQLKPSGTEWYSHPLYRDPGTARSIGIGIQYLRRMVWRKFNELLYRNQWRLIYTLEHEQAGANPFYRYKTLQPPKDRIWADPFVMRKDSRYFIFFEEKLFREKYGHICCLQMDEKGKLINSDPLKVLEEPWHLSYPFVFKYEGHEYMVPESGANRNVNLYRADGFPGGWVKVKTLLKGMYAYDSTLHFEDGYCWLFCTVKDSELQSSDSSPHIYYSPSLLEEDFVPHPGNPIYDDVRCSRPAGKIFKRKEEWIRPAQIGAPLYGSGMVFHAIERLYPGEYREKPIHYIYPNWKKNIRAVHTWNHEGGLSVADIQVKRFRWF